MDITILPEEMRALEQSFMADTAVPAALLMEHAAQGICAALTRRTPKGKALFLCGPGNNGGDGYAAARLWQAAGGTSILLEMSDAPRGDALVNRRLAAQAGIRLHTLTQAPTALPQCDAIVDALFGTGLSRGIDGMAADLIALVNRSGKPVIAVDIPSGVDGRDGRVRGAAIIAEETITFHRMKPGLLMGDGLRCAGTIAVHPILIPKDYVAQEGFRCLDAADVPLLIPPRPIDGHKGTFGHGVLLVGSRGMAGAAAMCTNACIHTGAGLTTVLCRESILPIVQTLAPGAVCIPLDEHDGRLTEHAAEQVGEALTHASAAAVGCGSGQGADLLPLLAMLTHADCPVVWDADALNLLALHPEWTLPSSAVLTPHPGEAARLLQCTVPDVTADPLAALNELHRRYGCSVLLKGARTLMTDGLHTAINRCGTPAMGKGGSGDILTGMLTALLARHLPQTALTVMQLAALLHGQAGLRASDSFGENCVTPERMIDCIRV